SWRLTLKAGPVPVFFEAVRLDIIQITWKITPDWDTSLGKTVTIKPTPPTAVASVRLPVPPGAVKTVTVEISGTWSTQGGNIRGFDIPAQNSSVVTATAKVGFIGSDETIAWLLTVQFISDGTLLNFG